MFTVAQYGDTGVTLGYELGSYKEIDDVQLLRSNGQYVSLGENLDLYTEVSYEDKDEDGVYDFAIFKVKKAVFNDVESMNKDRVWKVCFASEDGKTTTLPLTFTLGQ